MAFMFEKLEVYQKAVVFADQIIVLVGQFPRGFGFLGNQLEQAALSIATNLAEGNGRFSGPDRKHFFLSHVGLRMNAFHCWTSPCDENLFQPVIANGFATNWK